MNISMFKLRNKVKPQKDKHFIQKVLFIAVTVLLMFIFGAFFCDRYYNPDNDVYQSIYAFKEPAGGVLKENRVIEQPFAFDGVIRGVKLSIGTYGEEVTGDLTVELWHRDVKITSGTKDLNEISDCEPFTVFFDNEIKMGDYDYSIKLRASNIRRSNDMIFLGSLYDEEAIQKEKESEQKARKQKLKEMDEIERAVTELRYSLIEEKEFQKALINGEEIDACIGMQAVGYPSSLLEARDTFINLYLAIAISVVLIETIILFFHLKIENLFLLIAAILAVLYQVILLPNSAPDEDAHLTMVYHYSDILLGEDSKQEIIELNKAVKNGQNTSKIFELPTIVTRSNYLKTMKLWNKHNVDLISIQARSIAVTWVAYAPAIVGVTLGRILDFPILQTIYLGRAFASVSYIVLCYFGIKKIPGNKTTLALISLLPISLHLGSSFSYDSSLIGGAIFFTGLIFSLYQKKTRISCGDILELLLCILLLSSGKGLYAIMLGMVFLVPVRVWGGKAKQKLYLVALSSFSALSFLLNMGELLMNRVDIAMEGTKMQTSIIWQKPIEFIFLTINTFLSVIDAYVRGALGGHLGWFQFNIPMSVSIFVFLLLMISVVWTPGISLKMKTSWRVGAAVVFLLVCAGCLAAAISWNSADAAYIEGVQGRYFVPVLALFFLSISGWKQLELKKDISRFLILGIVYVNAFSLMLVTNMILRS